MGVLCYRNLSRVFSLKNVSLLLWVMKVYIVWVKSSRQRVSWVSCEMACLTKSSWNAVWHLTFQLSTCASYMAFLRESLLANFLRASCENALIFISCLIYHQLNTKSKTIKSYKIQGTKLMQLWHFLSWNKANIKYSCKSQLYKFKHFSNCNK